MNQRMVTAIVTIPLIAEYALGVLSHYTVWAALPALGIIGFYAVCVAIVSIKDLNEH